MIEVLAEPKKSNDPLVIKCPKCNEFGNLIARGRRKVSGKIVFMVRHKDHYCAIGVCNEMYDELHDIYCFYRGDRL